MGSNPYAQMWADIEGGDGLQVTKIGSFVLLRDRGAYTMSIRVEAAAALSKWIDGLTVADPMADAEDVPSKLAEAPSKRSPTGPLLARVAERLRAEIRKEFGTDWSIDVAENFASAAIDECYRARRERLGRSGQPSPDPTEVRPPPDRAGWRRHHLERDPVPPAEAVEGSTCILCWDARDGFWYPDGNRSCRLTPASVAALGWRYIGPVLFGADQPVQAASTSDGAAARHGYMGHMAKLEWQAEADRLTKREQLRLIEIAKNLPHDDPMRRLAVDLLMQAIHPEMKAVT